MKRAHRRLTNLLAAAALAGPAPLPADALAQSASEPATVQVRVLARDAKLVGDVAGGARVTITDAQTGAVLATGVTSGGTGDTDAIMTHRRTRGESIFGTPGAAGWTARFDLERPTLVAIAAEGPLDYPDATVRASKTLWLTPGAEVTGDGVVLELNGFMIDELTAEPAGDSVAVTARVRMLCTCPTEPGGLWSVERVTARLLEGDRVVAEVPLAYSGRTSVYEGAVAAPAPGDYVLEVVAADPATANFGRGTRPVEVGPPDGR